MFRSVCSDRPHYNHYSKHPTTSISNPVSYNTQDLTPPLYSSKVKGHHYNYAIHQYYMKMCIKKLTHVKGSAQLLVHIFHIQFYIIIIIINSCMPIPVFKHKSIVYLTSQTMVISQNCRVFFFFFFFFFFFLNYFFLKWEHLMRRNNVSGWSVHTFTNWSKLWESVIL